MNHNLKLFVLRLAVAALLAPVIPAFAQNATGFDYQFEGLALAQPASAPPAALRVTPDQVGFQLASDQLELTGTVRCATADAACQDGQAVTLALGNTNARLSITDGTSNTIMFGEFILSSRTPEGQTFGPVSGNARGSLSCDGAACQTLNVQVVACSTGGERQLGVVLTGSLTGPEPLSNLVEEEGISYYAWNSLVGTAYLTQPGSLNPICGGRNLDVVYTDGYQPEEVLPGRASDLPTEILPGTQGEVVDRDIVVKGATARLTDQGLQIGVRGYFFGQCGVEAQGKVWDDTDIVHVMIYRVIPDGTNCAGGVESFSLLLPYIEQNNVLKVGDRIPVNVNGQIIAILIGL